MQAHAASMTPGTGAGLGFRRDRGEASRALSARRLPLRLLSRLPAAAAPHVAGLPSKDRRGAMLSCMRLPSSPPPWTYVRHLSILDQHGLLAACLVARAAATRCVAACPRAAHGVSSSGTRRVLRGQVHCVLRPPPGHVWLGGEKNFSSL
jgi:hypothetical protein